MKHLLIFALLLWAHSVSAQTGRELIGTWKLVKETKDGKVTEPENTYQVFLEGEKFQGINGDKQKNGKWGLSADNKELTVKISVVKVKFRIEYFDSKRRVISSDMTGTLEYEKVPD